MAYRRIVGIVIDLNLIIINLVQMTECKVSVATIVDQ